MELDRCRRAGDAAPQRRVAWATSARAGVVETGRKTACCNNESASDTCSSGELPKSGLALACPAGATGHVCATRGAGGGPSDALPLACLGHRITLLTGRPRRAASGRILGAATEAGGLHCSRLAAGAASGHGSRQGEQR
mmetsp:Transcript_61872/g.199522  ORF Transcript_61872/g.199522 Transcript_61872/m.199522 type:complete len:139 (+) Transcript_61872:645-1061(+)